ncbi:M50 family metallopeptidase [Bacillus rubiinfantis]|uniref:M50 family metallopeptidase n=1 Tax=Bacillus rubiinfantis TaxID=1499680 RepID=UPI0005A881B7|nr:M50 family metallopeptidase [Bacillus rubiinfantis]
MFQQPFPIVIYLAVALLMTRIPFLRVYFAQCNTLLHEVIRVCIQGGMTKIHLHQASAAQMLSTGNSRFKQTVITYAGYTGASLAAIGLFYLVSRQQYHVILYLFIGFMTVSALMWIRNFSGFIWALSFAAILTLPLYFRYEVVIIHAGIFLASMVLVQSILNGIDVCQHMIRERKNPAREGFFAHIKLLPFLLFGMVLLGQSLFVGYYIIKNLVILSFHFS